MKLFFSLLLGLVIFFPAYSQDSLVCIPDKAARYYLEANEERWILREKDTIQTELILNLKEQVLVKDRIIDTYQIDSATYNSRYVTLLEQNTLKEERIRKLEGNIRLRKALEILAAIGIVVISIL